MSGEKDVDNILNFTAGAIKAQQEHDDVQSVVDKVRMKADDAHTKANLKHEEKLDRIQEDLAKKNQQTFIKRQDEAEKDADRARRLELSHQINRYFERYPWLAKKLVRPDPKMGEAELRALHFQIRDELNCMGSLPRMKSWVDRFFLIVGGVWGDGTRPLPARLPPSMRLNLSNIEKYEAAGAFDAEIVPLLEELNLEYPWLGRANLAMRTLETAMSIVTKVHVYNTNPAARKILNLENLPPVELTKEESETMASGKMRD